MALDPSDPSAVRSAAHDILSQPQFASEKMTWWKQALYYVQHPSAALQDLVDWILGRFTGNGVGTVFAWIFVFVALVVVGTIIYLLVRSTSRERSDRMNLVVEHRQISSADLIAEAEKFASVGNWKEAIRSRYSALVADLGTMGVVRLRPGKTTGEYLGEVRGNWPDAAITFAKVTELFELAWYGGSTLSADDFEVFKRCVADVRVSKTSVKTKR